MKIIPRMYLAHTALAVGLLYNFIAATGQPEENPNGSKENASDENLSAPTDEHTFVALIDILYTDGTQRTCTGTIIHDNVVITAAQCFNTRKTLQKVELTASFVVIGTKSMFETGYEQYLPIERVLTHPMYREWTADLSLVFTFADMTSDKPGTIIPLAGEKMMALTDTNVTVYSWGRAERVDPDCASEEETRPPTTRHDHVYSGSEDMSHSYEDRGTKRTTKKVTRLDPLLRHGSLFDEPVLPPLYKDRPSNIRTTKRNNNIERHEKRARDNDPTENVKPSKRTQKTVKKLSKTTESDIENVQPMSKTRIPNGKKLDKSKPFSFRGVEIMEMENIVTTEIPTTSNVFTNFVKQDDFVVLEHKPKLFSFKSYYRDWRRQIGLRSSKESDKPKGKMRRLKKSWRRQMDQKENHLSIDNSMFMNTQTCIEIVERIMPNEFNIDKNNDFVCYSSGSRVITDSDAGAPAIRNGKLVAVTVGAVNNDGEHIAVGMKMSCYCSWINDNLPSGAKKHKCCNNCCEIKHKGERKLPKRSRKNKHYD